MLLQTFTMIPLPELEIVTRLMIFFYSWCRVEGERKAFQFSWITIDDAVIIWPNLLFSMLKNDLSCVHVTCTQRASLFDELGGLKRLVFTIKPCREVRVRCASEDSSVSSRSHYALLRQTNRQQKEKKPQSNRSGGVCI